MMTAPKMIFNSNFLEINTTIAFGLHLNIYIFKCCTQYSSLTNCKCL